MVNTFDDGGGAARAAYRLHCGMRSISVDAEMLVLKKTRDDEFVQAIPGRLRKWIPRINPRLEKYLLRRYPNRQRQMTWSLNQIPYPVARLLNQVHADLYHFHWIGEGFIPITQLKHIQKPILWTLHDEWAFTGGCHYTFGCSKFTQTCGACPQLASKQENDLSRHILLQKSRSWRTLNLTVVTPSKWLADQARQSALFKDKRIEVIPNGIDIEQYKPIDRQAARKLLNLPLNKRLILFGAISSTSDERKGFHLLQPALAHLASAWGDEAELIVIGASERSDSPTMALKTHYLGHLHDDVSLALVYAAADVFVAPSMQENLPNTIMEALACGTPSIGFRIGGIPDLIEHQRNGYLAQPYEPEDLARGIIWVLEDKERHARLCARAREKVEQEFELKAISKRYLDLYLEIVSHSG